MTAEDRALADDDAADAGPFSGRRILCGLLNRYFARLDKNRPEEEPGQYAEWEREIESVEDRIMTERQMCAPGRPLAPFFDSGPTAA